VGMFGGGGRIGWCSDIPQAAGGNGDGLAGLAGGTRLACFGERSDACGKIAPVARMEISKD